MAEPLFKFQMRYVARKADPYYFTDWDSATTATVFGSCRDEANKKLRAMLGDPPSGYKWRWVIDRIDEMKVAYGEVEQ